MQKKIFVPLTLSLLGFTACKESVINALQIPTITLSSPSLNNGLSAITSADQATLTATFTHVQESDLSDNTGTSQSPPTGLKATRSGTVSCSNVALSSVTIAGATVTISGCTGDGVLNVQFLGETLTSSSSLTNKASTSASVRVDNTAPTATLAISAATVGSSTGANTVTATFSERVQSLSSSNANGEFTVTGCTTTQPTVSIVSAINGAGRTVATATLSGGDCDDGDTVTVELNLDKITDLAGIDGNSADNQQVTYNVTSQPVATLAAITYPASQTALGSTGAATSALSFVNVVSTTLSAASGNAGAPPTGLAVTQNGSADCTIQIVSPTIAGATIRLSNCTGQGSLDVEVDAGVATSGTGALNAVSN
ncbi:MAG: hypothetical protein AAGB31_04730, partial [Bdellovibrio sp.]